jgi:hypothetical protein
MEQRVLTRMRVGAQVVVSKHLADSLDFKIAEDYMADLLLGQLRAHVLGETVGQHQHDVDFAYPATWWHHLKQDVLLKSRLIPKWVRVRLGAVKLTVKRKTVHETVHATYPYASLSVPTLGNHVVFSVWENDGKPWWQ